MTYQAAAWTIETGSTPALWDVYDEDGNRIARDKTQNRATLIASAPQLAEENEALRALLTLLLSDPSDNSINAVWVDENYNPASPGDDGIRWFLTPYQIAEHKARAALKNIPTGEK